jgi:hypothetical protein
LRELIETEKVCGRLAKALDGEIMGIIYKNPGGGIKRRRWTAIVRPGELNAEFFPKGLEDSTKHD